MSLHLQPKLEGQLVRLIPLQSHDFEDLFLIASDPLIWEQHPENTRYQRDVFNRYFDSGIESQGAFIVRDSQSDELLGCTRFYNYDVSRKVISIGYTFLKRSCWGKPINREMKKLMIEYAFQLVEKIQFDIGENNLRSRKAVEKIGATFSELKNSTAVYDIKKYDYYSNPIII